MGQRGPVRDGRGQGRRPGRRRPGRAGRLPRFVRCAGDYGRWFGSGFGPRVPKEWGMHSGPDARGKRGLRVFVATARPVDSASGIEPSREAVWCSNASLTGHGGCWCWRRRKRACSTTASSAPSTSFSGLIHEGEGVAAKALEQLGISLEAVREKVEETIGLSGTAPTGSPPFTPRAKKVLELSLREALQLGHNYIGTEHMLLGLVREGEGVAAQVLVSLGADLARVRQQVIQLLSGYQGKESVGAGPGSSASETPVGLARARPVRPQPHPAGPRRQARPGHRAREGDRAGHAGAVAPHQEQPGAHRRARRRQDRHRRGPGPAHRGQRRARDAQGQAALHPRPRRPGGRQPLPRRLRGAPEEGPEGDPHPRRHHPVHRRAAHPRRRRARPRGPSTPPRS